MMAEEVGSPLATPWLKDTGIATALDTRHAASRAKYATGIIAVNSDLV